MIEIYDFTFDDLVKLISITSDDFLKYSLAIGACIQVFYYIKKNLNIKNLPFKLLYFSLFR